jgi:hydroxypyruvate reductase
MNAADAWWRSWLATVFHRSVAAADPARRLAPLLPALPAGRLVIVATGKAAEGMAREALRHYPPGRVTGVVVMPTQAQGSLAPLKTYTARHPVPDMSSVTAGAAVMQTVRAATEDDHVLLLLSGGASSLMVAPRPPFTLGDVARVVHALLSESVPIGELNLVRRHLDTLKGGGLARAAHPAKITVAYASDVVGDDVRTVGSGPATVQPWQPRDAAQVLRRHGLAQDRVMTTLEQQPAPPADDASASSVTTHLVTPQDAAVQAAAREAAQAGLIIAAVEPNVTGDACTAADGWASSVPGWRQRARAAGRPVFAVSGGETTVRVAGRGSGGPNSTFAVQFGLALNDPSGVHLLAADTDGLDGVGGHAGGYGDGMLWRGADRHAARAALRHSDTLGWLTAAQGAFITGRTGVNANDLRMVVVEP